MVEGQVLSTKEEEIVGGFKNALSRGETLEMAQSSFLNAGYSPQVVEMAVKMVMSESSANVPTAAPAQVNVPKSNLDLHAQKPAEQRVVGKTKSGIHSPVPYWVILLMIFISLLIVIGAGVLGLYWDKVMGLFSLLSVLF